VKVSFFRILLGIFILNLFLFVFAYVYPVPAIRSILGIPFLMFVPGFVLLAVLMPRRTDIQTMERVIISFVVSIIIDTVIGLLLNYTVSGITESSVAVSLAIFVLFVSGAAMIRQLLLPAGERGVLEFTLRLMKPSAGTFNFALTILMSLVLVGGVASGIIYSVSPKKSAAFTQFYIVQQEGGALYTVNSPSENDDVTITLGLDNNEGGLTTYKVQALINDIGNTEIDPIVLSNGEKWQQTITLPALSNTQTKVEFQLYKDNDQKPYLNTLRVWIKARQTIIVSQ
jgi:uncharacterized membrane protein